MSDRTLNGLDLDHMEATLALLQEQPDLAHFVFRATNRWVDGGENRSRIQGFYGAGAEDTSREVAFEFVNGEPPVLLGSNEGANPVEFLLHALAGCVTTTTVLHAAARGIRLLSIRTSLDGDIDLQGLLGMDEDVEPGYQAIRFAMDIQADCSDEELDDLIAFSQAHSPVCNTIQRPVDVQVRRVARA